MSASERPRRDAVPVAPLAELVGRHLPAPTADCPIFLEDSPVEPIVDGVAYFTELARLMARLGAGDAVYIAGYQADPELDLTGRHRDDPEYRPFTDVLAEKAVQGVDVRVVLSAAEFSGGVPWLPFGPFRANVLATRAMRAWVPSGGDASERPPLHNRVLLDWSGPALGSNHQKFVVFCLAGELTAYVGGLDLSPSRYDSAPHDRLRLGTHRWGWHDAAARVQGPAAHQVWETRRSRHRPRYLAHAMAARRPADGHLEPSWIAGRLCTGRAGPAAGPLLPPITALTAEQPSPARCRCLARHQERQPAR